MASISDSDESSGDLPAEWTELNASPKGEEETERSAIVSDASSSFEDVAIDVNVDEASVERLGSSGTVTSESVGAPDGTATTTGQQQIYLMAKDIGAIQHAALQVSVFSVFLGLIKEMASDCGCLFFVPFSADAKGG